MVREAKGVITVFLAMTFIFVTTLILTLVESARTAGLQYYTEVASDAAIDSLFSEYHNDLWDTYRIFGYMMDDTSAAELEYESFLEPYLKADNWFSMKGADVQLNKYDSILDGEGQWLEEEVSAYMRYGAIDGLFSTEDTASEVWKALKEAKSMQNITNDYGEHSREAIQLENALQRINDNLEKQRRLKSQAMSALSAGNNSKFQSLANQLKNAADDLPALVCDYSTKADELNEHLEATHASQAEQYENLSDDGAAVLDTVTVSYGDYAAADSVRRQKVENLAVDTDRNLSIIKESKSLADEIEEFIDELEEGEEEDFDEDIDELWEMVSDLFDDIKIGEMDCQFGITEEGKKKEGFIENAKNLLSGNLLELVIPDGRSVSEGRIDLSLCPSHEGTSKRSKPDPAVIDNVLSSEYIAKYFDNFCDPSVKDLWYEMEYICEGKASDKENLSDALIHIYEIREGMNYLHIMMDSDKREAANSLAGTIVGSVGLPVLTPVLACLIIGVWAGIESLIDLRALLSGKKVSLMKTDAQWKTDIDGILSFGESKELNASNDGDSSGIRYEQYLKFLLMLLKPNERNLRMLDIIEKNIKLKDESFAAGKCIYGMDMKVNFSAKRLFGFFGNDYVITTHAYKAY